MLLFLWVRVGRNAQRVNRLNVDLCYVSNTTDDFLEAIHVVSDNPTSFAMNIHQDTSALVHSKSKIYI